MNAALIAICARTVEQRIDALCDDLRLNADYYSKADWRGAMRRLRAARELRDLRRARVELRFMAWGRAA